MRLFVTPRFLAPAALVFGTLTAISVVVGSGLTHLGHSTVRAASTACSSDESGLKLPPGFCATIFADGIGHARHLVVAPHNVVYVNTWSSDYYPAGEAVHEGGFLVALQDKSGNGKADVIERFGGTMQDGAHGGTGIALYSGSIYAEVNDRIIRYKLPHALVPSDPPVTIVSGLPLGGDHPMHPFYIGNDGMLYVDVATATNACQLKNRSLHSPGADPCKELETRGGIWRYDAKKTDQTFSPSERYATGIRNAEGFGIDKAKTASTSHSTDATSSTPIGPRSINPHKKPRCPRKKLCSLPTAATSDGPNATTTLTSSASSSPLSTAAMATKRAFAPPKPAPSQPFLHTGDPTAWSSMTRSNFQPLIATASSSLSMAHGTVHLTPRAAITSSSRLSRPAVPPAGARSSPTDLPAVSSRRKAPSIAPRELLSDRTAPCMSPTT